jgi:hypothetical protein
MSTTTTTACHCSRCTIERAGVAGPFTPAEFARLGLAARVVTPARDESASDDVGVKAAELGVREAWEAWEPLQRAWLQAVAAHRQAEMPTEERYYTDGRGGLFSPGAVGRQRRVAELAEQVKATREAMELAWKDVVRANDRAREALQAARVRVAESARGG